MQRNVELMWLTGRDVRVRIGVCRQQRLAHLVTW
jgi:hypothetical protein